MSLLDVLTGLRRLHSGYQRVQAMRTNYRRFEAAARFNPRRSDDWDILQMRDSDIDRLITNFGQVETRTRSMQRAAIPVENRAREVRQAITAWFAAYAEDGPESRAATQAQTTLYVNLHEWSARLGNQRRDCNKSREEVNHYMRGYRSLIDLFQTLKDLAAALVRYHPDSAQRAVSLARMVQFEEVVNSARRTMRNFEAALSRQRAWLRQLDASQRELDPLLNWSTNRRNVERDLERQRPPR